MNDVPRGVRYVPISKLTWRRKGQGKGFVYVDEKGKALKKADMERVKKLVIPPAWAEVMICPLENGHIQAVGMDDKGRKQYIYHPKWVEQKQQAKFDGMVRFGELLPELRATVTGHMRQRELTRERVLSTVVWLLEHTFIRVGNEVYEKENQSYGLTTMREKHVKVRGESVKFAFKGKSGVYHELSIRHPRVSETIKKCLELPGYKIFQYLDADGERRRVDSQEVNEYLKLITGEELSAKDFRTWGGTTLAGEKLYKVGSPESEAAAKKTLVEMFREVSEHLGATATVCRKYYVHPLIVESYEKDKLVPHFRRVLGRYEARPGKLRASEEAAWTLLKKK